MAGTNTSIVHVTFEATSHHAQTVLDKYKKIASFEQLFGRISSYSHLTIGTRYSINCNQTLRGWLRDRPGQFSNDHFKINVEL